MAAITGRIYRIISDSHPEVLPYYGSTTRTLKLRWYSHRSKDNHTVSKQLMEFDDVRIELLEEFICESITALHQREQWYIDNHQCCNKYNTTHNAREYLNQWNKDNKERKKAYNKAYRDKKKLEASTTATTEPKVGLESIANSST